MTQLDLFADYAPKVAISARPARPNCRTARGQTGYYAGAAAEDIVARHYELRGMKVLEKRWRGKAGEIDLIISDGDSVVLVEVKKSRSFEQAAVKLAGKQIGRIFRAGNEFLGTQPKGLLTDARFDLALVDGSGAVQIIENAFHDV